MNLIAYCLIALVRQMQTSLAVDYSGDVREYCQLETFTARCRHGDVIVMTTAKFGRMRFGKCIDSSERSAALQKIDPDSIGCYADVLDYADRMCSGKTTCDIFVPNRDLLSTRPCFTQLTMYFEAAYQCLSVVKEDRSCVVKIFAGLRQHIRSSSESSNRQRVRCGSRSHPWLLEAQTGQQVNISLLDFSGHGQQTQVDTRGLVSDECGSGHVQYGYVVDKSNKNNVSVCSTAARQRHKHVYQSAGNLVELVTPHQRDDNSDEHWNFMLSFTAVGCSNLVPASDAWLRRTDDEATIGCYTTRQRWNLRCDGNQWKGTIGVCSEDADVIATASRSKVDHLPSGNDEFINVLLIVSISFVGLAVCLIVIFVGVGCARRYQLSFTPGTKNFLEGSNNRPLVTDSGTDRTLLHPSGAQYQGRNYPRQYFVLEKDEVANNSH